MSRLTLATAAVLLAGAAHVAHATPNCTRKPGHTTEVSTSGTRYFPLSGPCHVLSIGPPAGVTVVGYMIIVAAGGWDSNPQAVRNFHNRHAQRFADDGFMTYTVEHTPGNGTALGPATGSVGFSNLRQHYDEVRAFLDSLPNGTAYPICAFGESSGGNFALLLGVARPALDCVIAQGAPTDLRTVSPSMPASTRQIAIDAFGAANLATFSPIAWPAPAYLAQDVLLGHGHGDAVVGRAQATDFCASRPASAACYVLDTVNGTATFTHVKVTPAALAAFEALQRSFAP